MATEMPRAKLKKIKESAFSRGLALAKVSMSAGAKAAGHAIGGVFASEADKPDRFKALLMSQVTLLTRELGQLKGSVMKVGQMLSMFGEHFLPPEVNEVLKSLQSQAPPLDWPQIEKQLKRNLTPEQLDQLDIEREPLASASLGQVHLATRKSDGRKIALKIQYPGVDHAIEGDIKALRSLLSLSKLIPRTPAFDELFKEVRQMLHQEVDYARELELTREFAAALKDDLRYVVPEVFPEFSSKRVIATSFEPGIAIDSPEVKALPQERRNAIARMVLELYFIELFTLGMMQTDPHFGNYRLRLGENGEPDRLVLLDFGAVRKFPRKFLEPYYEMVGGAFRRDRERILRGARGLGFTQDGDEPELLDRFADLCMMFAEAFHVKDYDWASSDLPRRIASQGAQMALKFKLRAPPREVVFLDRKMGGIFIFMSTLKARFDVAESFERYFSSADGETQRE
jgi:predicted unusual protein kinase regulating ubiquinone biosynthesis (AarF/ABC1/UbiB family)